MDYFGKDIIIRNHLYYLCDLNNANPLVAWYCILYPQGSESHESAYL